MEHIINAQDDSTPEPMIRHTCPVCHRITPASRGAECVTCGACGHIIIEGGLALDGFRMYLERHFPSLMLDPAFPVRDYARLDTEITYYLIKLPLEMALERRRLVREG